MIHRHPMTINEERYITRWNASSDITIIYIFYKLLIQVSFYLNLKLFNLCYPFVTAYHARQDIVEGIFWTPKMSQKSENTHMEVPWIISINQLSIIKFGSRSQYGSSTSILPLFRSFNLILHRHKSLVKTNFLYKGCYYCNVKTKNVDGRTNQQSRNENQFR